MRWEPGPPPEQVPGEAFFCRIYRGAGPAKAEKLIAELPFDNVASFTDRSIEWDKTYSYRATVVTMTSDKDGIEGDDTPTVSVLTRDIFPPKVPSGMQAVFSGESNRPFIDLIWNINQESDLQGYNVYRHESGGPPARINSVAIKTPSYRDFDVSTGKTYFYSVSAVDLQGNESARSEETTESVP